MNIVGNRNASYGSGSPKGVGVPSKSNMLGWTSIVANADDAGKSIVISLTSIGASSVDTGIFFQASSPVTLEFTLSAEAIVTSQDPNVQAMATWGNNTALAANDIIQSPVLFTAVKITFQGAATVNIGAL